MATGVEGVALGESLEGQPKRYKKAFFLESFMRIG